MKYSEIQKYYREGKFEESKGYNIAFYLFFAVAVICLIIVPYFILQTVPILQDSMYPTIVGGNDRADPIEFEDKVGLSLLSGYGRGDIVVFRRSEHGSEKRLIKRVLALPGEQIRLEQSDGKYFVKVRTEESGELREYWLGESYVNPESPYMYNEASGDWAKGTNTGGENPDKVNLKADWYTLKSDEVFVAGDNRSLSQDSFLFGPVKKSAIEGKVVCIYKKCGYFLFFDLYMPHGTGVSVTLVNGITVTTEETGASL